MEKKQLLELLAKILPETVEFELREQKRGSGHYAIANVESKTRMPFSLGNAEAEGNPKITFIFGSATPKGVAPKVKAPSNHVSLDAWKNQYAK